ncbi:divergent PAP2 family protein [Radiobacillus deserti]|uniref:Divergent PAP2 family protein n=1 Tax=Radiobacillus deserti TaxID=2594883 RepID=A0A516KJL2_9BACI|nr:divergent PAP2 family protein [Radiobacillus deserti]QDP41600.1 divergent PAP2 family protein [Radiobacillus deserti]
MPYFLAPMIGWFTSGCLKFIINYLRFGKDARHRTGNGGFPSTHTATVSSPVLLVGMGEGWFSPAFGIGVAFLLIVIIDATGLRIAVGKQAGVLNLLTVNHEKREIMRERMGHTKLEVLGGLLVGLLVSTCLYWIFTAWGWTQLD